MEAKMDFSSANVPLWRFVIQMGIIAFTVILANIIRRKIPLIKKTYKINKLVVCGPRVFGNGYLSWNCDWFYCIVVASS